MHDRSLPRSVGFVVDEQRLAITIALDLFPVRLAESFEIKNMR
jgi:hypothetical protein